MHRFHGRRLFRVGSVTARLSRDSRELNGTDIEAIGASQPFDQAQGLEQVPQSWDASKRPLPRWPHLTSMWEAVPSGDLSVDALPAAYLSLPPLEPGRFAL
jgi:hypothetical protein